MRFRNSSATLNFGDIIYGDLPAAYRRADPSQLEAAGEKSIILTRSSLTGKTHDYPSQADLFAAPLVFIVGDSVVCALS